MGTDDISWGQRLVWAGFGFALASAALILGPWRPRAEPAPRPATPPIETPAAVSEPRAGAARCYLGVVLAGEAVDVAARGDGRLEQVLVAAGDRVERGQPVARLDAESVRHQLAIERANLDTAKLDHEGAELELERAELEYQRRRDLSEIISGAEIERARFDRDAARLRLETADAARVRATARLAELRSALDRTVVRAPFAGRVARRYLDPGALTGPGRPILRLITSGELRARFAVPPEDAAGMTVGMTVRVEIANPPITLEARVDRVPPELDAASQMIFVEARLGGDAVPGVASGTVARVSAAAVGDPPCPRDDLQ